MILPTQYKWLEREPGPKMLLELLDIYGTKEIPGAANSPAIIGWAKELGLKEYNADSIPWCGLAMAIAAFRAGKTLPKNPLWALNWAEWGTPVKQAMLGDVLTFRRNGGGHVSLYIGEDSTAYHCLGGNQGDAVSIVRIAKDRLYKAVRPPYNNQPANVRKVILSASGGLSQNEA